MRASLRLLLAAGLVTSAGGAVGCAAPAASPDAGYDLGDPPDARRTPGFRDAGGCEPGGSGTGSGTGAGSGDGCGSGSGSGETPPDATPCDLVTFTYTGAATSVWVTGSFTSWAAMPPEARPLGDDGAGHWSVQTRIGAGRQLYKFIIDGTTWIADPANPETENDGYGGRNSVVTTCDSPG